MSSYFLEKSKWKVSGFSLANHRAKRRAEHQWKAAVTATAQTAMRRVQSTEEKFN